MTEDEIVGWHHQLNGHEFGQTPGDRKGQRTLACCSPWGCKESDMTQRLKNNNDKNNTIKARKTLNTEAAKALFPRIGACCGPVLAGSMEEMLEREEHCRNLHEKRGSSEQYEDKILKEG